MQTHTSEPNRRSIAQQKRRRYERRAMAQQERRRRERLKNIVNQSSTSHQEIETGQSECENQTLIPKPNKRSIAQQERKQYERLENMVN
ncbi:hypothetical protein F8M41_026158 [Gigaspora margarita]|uniref:Uncharacterized protein n=1 Tax=Gigaspora margarita TaxID=4874 RepID=A0A8H3XHD8_GIGMA|nr:hypothetical protein F8M41_026158 [Gigaspora margarita]